ncbi:TniQ family protein [Oceanobacillus sp. CAU 1775]
MTIRRQFLLIEDESITPNKVTWLPEWISPYESPWSIFEKFKYANRATVIDLFELFGTRYSKGLRAANLSQKACNLLTLEGMDESSLIKTFGLSIKEVNRRNINMLTNIMEEGSSNLYFHSHLKICPECIKIGYHSIFHQFSLVHSCPFHNISLVEGCPECSRVMYYRLSDKDTKEPFRCKCGHLLFSLEKGQRYPSAWKKLNVENQSTPLKYWIMFNLEGVHDKIALYFHQNIDLQKNSGLMEFILEAISPSFKTSQSALHRHVKSSPYILSLQKLTQNKSNYITEKQDEFQLKKEIYQSSKATMKSIVSNVRKVFYKHASCIKDFQKNVYKTNTNCPYAYAFLSWRKFNEGDNSIHDVKRRKEIPFFNSLEYRFGTEQDHNYLNDSLFKMRTHYSIKSLAALKWILNRIMGHLTVNHLKNWLRMAPIHAQDNTMFSAVPFKLECLPFYLIIIPKSKNECLEFHWWHEKDTLQLRDIEKHN